MRVLYPMRTAKGIKFHIVCPLRHSVVRHCIAGSNCVGVYGATGLLNGAMGSLNGAMGLRPTAFDWVGRNPIAPSRTSYHAVTQSHRAECITHTTHAAPPRTDSIG
jgi:hypothetical protein